MDALIAERIMKWKVTGGLAFTAYDGESEDTFYYLSIERPMERRFCPSTDIADGRLVFDKMNSNSVSKTQWQTWFDIANSRQWGFMSPSEVSLLFCRAALIAIMEKEKEEMTSDQTIVEQFDQLKQAYRLVQKYFNSINKEMHDRATRRELWQNSFCEDWSNYQKAIDDYHQLEWQILGDHISPEAECPK